MGTCNSGSAVSFTPVTLGAEPLTAVEMLEAEARRAQLIVGGVVV